MIIGCGLFCAALGLVVMAGPYRLAAEATSRPVMIGGEAELDACGAIGAVSNLKPEPGNTLSVRSGPGLQFDRIDGLAPGTRVWLCDRQGDWLGIVYPAASADCGVTTQSAARRPYGGPCLSGWVYDRHVELLAG